MAKRKSKKKYVTLDVFEKFLRKSGIENDKEYAEAYRRKLIPTNELPKTPSEYYHKPSDRVKYLPFKKARKYVRKLELQGREADAKPKRKRRGTLTYFDRKSKLPRNIPRVPQQVYEKYWKGWNDFIGVERADYNEARRLDKKLKLTSQRIWNEYAKKQNHLGRIGFMIDKKKDMRIGVPYVPSIAYAKYWKSWGDFTGSGNVQSQKRKFRLFKEARKYAHTLNLVWMKEWKEMSKKHKLPFDLPSNPKKVYGDKGWKGFEDFLGIKHGSSKRRTISHSDAVARGKKCWANRRKKGNTGWSKDDPRRKTNKTKRKRRKSHAIK